MKRFLNPESIHAPFGHYSHGVLVPPGARWLLVSGALGIARDGAIPECAREQTRLCFRNAEAVLRAAAMSLDDIVRVCAFVTDRAYMVDYMAVRDEFVPTPPPASTLIVVSGFTRPEFKVEVEVTAAAA